MRLSQTLRKTAVALQLKDKFDAYDNVSAQTATAKQTPTVAGTLTGLTLSKINA